MDNTTYEFFIRRAWKCDRFEKGANTDTWESLLYKKYHYDNAIGKPNEAKEKLVYDKKFAEIKNFVDAAYNNLLFRATSIENSDDLVNRILDLKNTAMSALTPTDLYNVMRSSFTFLNENNL